MKHAFRRLLIPITKDMTEKEKREARRYNRMIVFSEERPQELLIENIFEEDQAVIDFKHELVTQLEKDAKFRKPTR